MLIFNQNRAGEQISLNVTESNQEAHPRLRKTRELILVDGGVHPTLMERSLYLGEEVTISGTAHRAGTEYFGIDPATSVLDLDCKAHEIDNLYVIDASFSPSIGAVNPTLTIIANTLRAADRIKQRLGALSHGSLSRCVRRTQRHVPPS